MKRLLLLLATIFILHPALHAQTSPRVAIVLSGGGALGYAHIGALQALDEASIRPTFIAGTSMGAIVGAVYAQGYSADQLFHFVVSRHLHSARRNVHASLRHANQGIGSYKHVRQLLNDAIPHDSFDSLAIPFLCVATNIRTGTPEVRTSGSHLADWVLASASIPVVFKPQLIDGDYYCDGGFVDNLPACHVPASAYDILIAIDLVPSHMPPSNDYFTLDYMVHDIYGNMILDINSTSGRQCCHHIIRPHLDVRYGILDFHRYKELRQRGYEAMQLWLQSHPEVIPQKDK